MQRQQKNNYYCVFVSEILAKEKQNDTYESNLSELIQQREKNKYLIDN